MKISHTESVLYIFTKSKKLHNPLPINSRYKVIYFVTLAPTLMS